MSIKFNPNTGWSYEKEYDQYQTVFDILPTDPAVVTKQEKYSYKYGPYDMFTGWSYRTVVDEEKIKQNQKITHHPNCIYFFPNLTISIDSSFVLATCSGIFCLNTPSLFLKVKIIAPSIATKSIHPEI